MTIPYRDEQILRILAANPDGLTTGQILAIAKTQRGNELPNSNIISQRMWSMRNSKTPQVASLDTSSGRVHKITAAGRQLIADLDRNNPAATPAATVEPVDTAQPTIAPTAPHIEQPRDANDNWTQPTDGPVDILQQYDQAAAIIREAFVATLNAQAEPIKIADKQTKVDLLEKLENMPFIEPWAADLLAEIRGDLDQLEDA